jgi:SAM-dependent methyltransferase
MPLLFYVSRARELLKHYAPTPVRRLVRKYAPQFRRAVRPPTDGRFWSIQPLSKSYGFDRGVPVDRYYIEAFLERHADVVAGSVLEVESDDYTRRFGGSRVTHSTVLDIDPANERATLIGDLNEPGALPTREYDCVILTQTLQYVFHLTAAIRTLHDSLKPGGVLLLTLPAITRIPYEISGERWLWSFSQGVARKLVCEAFPREEVIIETYGNLLASTAFLHGLAVEDLPSPAELDMKDLDFQVLITVFARRPS